MTGDGHRQPGAASAGWEANAESAAAGWEANADRTDALLRPVTDWLIARSNRRSTRDNRSPKRFAARYGSDLSRLVGPVGHCIITAKQKRPVEDPRARRDRQAPLEAVTTTKSLVWGPGS